jgi:hypothetical protein
MSIVNYESLRLLSDSQSPLGKLASKSIDKVETNAKPIDFDYNVFASRLPRTGEWSGERGNSEWTPNREDIPLKENPQGKTWGEIMDSHDVDSISFKDGEPDFSEISKGNVEIDDFSTSRYGAGGNFDQADHKLAEQKGCSPDEVRTWRAENGYTWHEKSDCRTMRKVPQDIHMNVPHDGGISAMKKQQELNS